MTCYPLTASLTRLCSQLQAEGVEGDRAVVLDEIVGYMQAYEHGDAETTDLNPKLSLEMLRDVLQDLMLALASQS